MENKSVDQLLGNTARLVCAFVFAYADCWFSDVVAQLCCEGHNFLSSGDVNYKCVAIH